MSTADRRWTGWDIYQVKTDKDSGIINDPNLYSDDSRYVVELIKRVTYVALETVKLIEALPALEEVTPDPGVMPPAWQSDNKLTREHDRPIIIKSATDRRFSP